ncbi:MAG TPA: hypothetical protein VF800_21795 [Telluria sp.]|jgi:hypothetical protein
MSGDVAFVAGPLRFLLEFAEVDPMGLGVQVRLEVEYLGQSQSLKWTAEHLWFEYEALLRFESELGDGSEARLQDMSEYPILHFVRDSYQESLTINPPSQRQSQDGDSMGVSLKVNAGSMQALYSALSQFGKWW